MFNFLVPAFLLIFAFLGIPLNSMQKKNTQLTGIHLFLVRYTFEDEFLAPALKEEMIRSLQKGGKVFLEDDSKLTSQEKTDKYQIGQPIIEISVSSIVEENINNPPKFKKLPVIELSIQVLTGVEVINNQQKTPCSVWEKQMFISSIESKKELKQKTTKRLEAMLDQFVTNYKEANSEKQPAPQFFLCFYN